MYVFSLIMCTYVKFVITNLPNFYKVNIVVTYTTSPFGSEYFCLLKIFFVKMVYLSVYAGNKTIFLKLIKNTLLKIIKQFIKRKRKKVFIKNHHILSIQIRCHHLQVGLSASWISFRHASHLLIFYPTSVYRQVKQYDHLSIRIFFHFVHSFIWFN